jgi:hypothetical protein
LQDNDVMVDFYFSAGAVPILEKKVRINRVWVNNIFFRFFFRFYLCYITLVAILDVMAMMGMAENNAVATNTTIHHKS